MKLFKGYSEKEVKRVMPIVQKINSFEDVISELTDEELKAKTEYFKELLAEGQKLDDILPEAFAVVREASKRVTGLRHFDVQLIGGIILHQGRIAEMRTGEGKTLVATLPAYLNALTGKGVHVITVNDYLAKRDSEWMGKIYSFLGLTVGLVIADMKPNEKQKAYNCDITYGTNNEFGFDYLRDNMVIYKDQLVQRPLNYAIVDEIDSILIDEARTPLIISGRANQASDIYKKADRFVAKLEARTIIEEDVKDEEQAAENEKYDYVIDLKAKSASLTAKGIEKAEKEFELENLNDLNNSELVHAINQALRAHGIMKKDVDYIVKSGEVLIVDEFTGRIMYGRRYNNGLHQAIEAKEHVKVADESKTLANITFQNYFRMYEKLSGMTGTAMTEEQEFEEIYKLDVIEIPTNKPIQRKDLPDIIYKNETGKFNAVIEDIKKSYEKGQPVLVGTVSIDKSERLSKLLDKAKIPHQVLNAKYHEKESIIGEENMREVERMILLQVVDSKWMDHIDAMDQLKQGIGLRAIGQDNPVRAYQIEGFDMFDQMVDSIQEETVSYVYGFEIKSQEQPNLVRHAVIDLDKVQEKGGSESDEESEKMTPVVKDDKVGRNDPCPCGSGKKYKNCCGR